MSHKLTFIYHIVLLLLIASIRYWDSWLGPWAFPTFMLILLLLAISCLMFLAQFILAIREKFCDRQRLLLLLLIPFTITFFVLFPAGIIPSKTERGKNLLVATRESAANCMTTFTLKADQRFFEQAICFGASESTGTYKIIGDTIIFTSCEKSRWDDDEYTFAIIRQPDSSTLDLYGDIDFYTSYNDTAPRTLWISENYITSK